MVSKEYYNLPEHYGLLISFELWFIDSIQEADYITLTVDGQVNTFYKNKYKQGSDFKCGSL